MKRRKSLNDHIPDDGGSDKKLKPLTLIKSRPTFTLECYKSTIYSIIFVFLIKLLLLLGYLAYLSTNIDYDLAFFDGGNARAEIQVLFEKYDRNDDKILDINEFEPLAHKLLTRVFDFANI
jgi:hypothetical protein